MFFLFSLLACSPEPSINIEPSQCLKSKEKIDITDQVQDFSWQDWMTEFADNGEFSGASTIYWQDSSTDCLTWQFIPNPETTYLVTSDEASPSVRSLVECEDTIEISGSLSLQSGDGRINETLAVTMQHVLNDQNHTTIHTIFSVKAETWDGSLGSSISQTDRINDQDSFQIELSMGEDGLSGQLSILPSDLPQYSVSSLADFDDSCQQTLRL